MKHEYKIGDIVIQKCYDNRLFEYEIIDIDLDTNEYIYMFLTKPDPVAELNDFDCENFEDFTYKKTKLHKALF